MNITREQYDADIRAAKVDAWDEGVNIATDHAALKRVGVSVDDLYNPYRKGSQ